jgi:L,D-peptidoglycan transpeptidase YkuD (ErfK/YbiS/YcfS/YnhG family)
MKKTILTAALLLSFAAGSLTASPALAEDSSTQSGSPTGAASTADATPPATSTDSGASVSTPGAVTTEPSVADTATTAPNSELPEPAPEPVVEPPAPAPDPAPDPDPAPAPDPVFTTGGGIGSKWLALNGAAGVLGSPTSNEACSTGLCVQTFEGGSIYWTSATGAHPVFLSSGQTGPFWHKNGGLAAFGYPVTDETARTGKTFQKFSSGKILVWTGTAVVVLSTTSGIGSRWVLTGGEAVLGLPLAAEACGLIDGGCSQAFDKGTIFWSPQSGGHFVWGGIAARWRAAGAQNGILGYPTTDELCGQTGNGCVQTFQRGRIYWSPATGAWITNGAIGTRYNAAGAHRGLLGYPTSNEACGQTGNGCVQTFQRGRIYWSPTTGAWVTRGGIGTKYASVGANRSSLGYPTSNERCTPGQCIQSFQRGYIGWTATAGTRVYAMTECAKLNNGQTKYSAYGANRVLLTFTSGYNRSYATNVYCVRMAGLYVADWKTDGYVGASGFKPPGVPSGPTRYLFSPTGSYSVTEAFGLGNPGTKLAYRTLNPNSRWGGNPWTATYNKYFESSSWVGWDENMWYFATRSTHDYRQGVVINYNRPNIVQNAGFAIFLHMNKVPTAGCISLDDWAVVDYIRKSTPGDRIIMGTYNDIFR